MFDISKTNVPKAHEEGYEFEVNLPDGTPTGFFIKVRGPESKAVKDYAFAQLKEMQKRDGVLRGKNKPVDYSPEEIEERLVNNCISKIISWRGLADGEEKGKPIEVPFTKDFAFGFLKDNKWIRDQITEASEDVTNFRC